MRTYGDVDSKAGVEAVEEDDDMMVNDQKCNMGCRYRGQLT